MKRFSATWLMSVLVAGLAGYTYYEYKNASRDLDRAQGERQAFELTRDDISEIRLTSRGESTLLRKEGDEWKVVEPVKDNGESTAIEGFLFQATALKLKTFLSPEDGKPDFAKYGLDPAPAVIELSGKGRKETLSVSSKAAFDGSHYVRLGDDVLLADAQITQLSERPASNFRSRKLWRAEGATVDKATVTFDGGKEKLSFARDKDGKWNMEPAPGFTVDSGKVETWIEKIQDLLPSEFEKEGLGPEDKSKYLLAKPAAEIVLAYKDKDGKDAQWTLTLGQDRAEDVFLFTDQRPTIYKTSKASVAPIRVAKAYFRDGKAPFQFEVEKAREVHLKTANVFRVFKKTENGWALAEESKELELDQEKLVQLFQNIRNLEAQEFVAGAGGFKGPPQVEIRGEGGQVLLQLAWGDEYKAKSPWNNNSAFRYVKSSLSKEVMGVAKDKLDKLVDSSLVRKKASEPAKPQDNKSSSTPEKK